MGAVRKKYPAIVQSRGAAAIYLYGLLSAGLAQRTGEIGVRVTEAALDGRIVLGEENNSPGEKWKSLMSFSNNRRARIAPDAV
jgi:hypothetical protein